MKFKKAAVVFITGQSNAHAHGQYLPEQERITVPMKNVFALDREQNQSFELEDVVWSGFTTQGKNIGEWQDYTASLAYYLAVRWQDAIDAGGNLPDLYIVQMSIGSQGIINGMWNPDWPKAMEPGTLDVVNISLYPFAQKIFPMVLDNLHCQGLEPEVIGWHWLGSEQEVCNGAYEREDFESRYDSFFNGMLSFIGTDCPTYLYKLYFQKYCEANNIPPYAVDKINQQFERQCHHHRNMQIVRAEDCPNWDENHPNWGIFCFDNGHYLASTQEWFADQFFQKVYKT